jgi:hypothetical protein
MNPKKLITSLIATLIIISESIAGGKPSSCLLFSIAPGNKARLGVVNSSTRSMNLEILNVSGIAFFNKSISVNENYFQMLDLSKMADGEYTVKLKGSENEFEKKFVIRNKTAILTTKAKETPPVFQMIDDETLFVSYLNPDNKEVNIYFELNNEVVFEDRGLKGSQLSKKYSLKKLPKGAYDVKVYSDGRVFNYPVAIK